MKSIADPKNMFNTDTRNKMDNPDIRVPEKTTKNTSHQIKVVNRMVKKYVYTVYVQCILKVFRPLECLHILLRYSLILKFIKLFFPPSSNDTKYPIISKQKQV